MTFEDRGIEPSGRESGSRLPQEPRDFRLELLRRLELVEREVQTLLGAVTSGSRSNSVAKLWALESELKERIAADVEAERWMETRAEIIVIWSEHRREFERLATEFRQRFEARPGRRKGGPRW